MARHGLRRILVIRVLFLGIAGAAIQARVPTYGLDFALGKETTNEYTERYLFCCGGATILQLLDAQPDARRAYALYDPPRLYARTPLSRTLISPNGAVPDMRDPAAVLAALDAGGYTHLLISRRYLPADWAQSQLMDETFLRRYTTLVGNGPNTYLYRILPPDERATPAAWTSGPELLGNTVPSTIRIAREDAWAATVPVLPQHRYLLDTTSSGVEPIEGAAATNYLTLHLEWHDATGQIISDDNSNVPVETENEHRFSLAGSAPTNAATVTVRLETQQIPIQIAAISLREAVGGVEAGIGP